MTDPTDEQILGLLREGHDPYSIAEGFCDAEVARGEYEGCSTELELAFTEYERRANELKESA